MPKKRILVSGTGKASSKHRDTSGATGFNVSLPNRLMKLIDRTHPSEWNEEADNEDRGALYRAFLDRMRERYGKVTKASIYQYALEELWEQHQNPRQPQDGKESPEASRLRQVGIADALIDFSVRDFSLTLYASNRVQILMPDLLTFVQSRHHNEAISARINTARYTRIYLPHHPIETQTVFSEDNTAALKKIFRRVTHSRIRELLKAERKNEGNNAYEPDFRLYPFNGHQAQALLKLLLTESEAFASDGLNSRTYYLGMRYIAPEPPVTIPSTYRLEDGRVKTTVTLPGDVAHYHTHYEYLCRALELIKNRSEATINLLEFMDRLKGEGLLGPSDIPPELMN